MIAAHDLIAFEVPHRERQQPVPAGILECRDLTVAAAVQHHVFLANGAGGKLMLDLMAPGRRVPRVQWKWFFSWHGIPPLNFEKYITEKCNDASTEAASRSSINNSKKDGVFDAHVNN